MKDTEVEKLDQDLVTGLAENRKGALKEFADSVSEKFVRGWELTAEGASKIKSALSSALTSASSTMSAAFQSIGSAFQSLWKGFKDTVSKIAGYVDEKLGVSDKAKAIGALCVALFKKVKDFGAAAGKAIANKAKAAGESMGKVANALIVEPLKGASKIAGKFATKVKERVSGKKEPERSL
jgi:hypothetical protein